MITQVKRSLQAPVHPEPFWANILEYAAVEVFEMMAGVRLELFQASSTKPRGDQTAIVGMAGALCGMITVRCSGITAAKLSSLMLDEDSLANPVTMADALGELCNMIAGNFKAKINTLADHCMLSVPTVIIAEEYVMQPARPIETFVVTLDYEGEPIWVSLIVHL